MTSAVNLFPRVTSNVEDTAKVIADQAEQRQAARPTGASERQREFARQHQELAQLEDQLKQREHVVRVLTPAVASSKHQVKQLKAAIAATTDRDERAQLEKLLWRASDDLKNESERLECSERLVASYTKLISEFNQRNADFAGAVKQRRTVENALPRHAGVSSH